MLAPVPDEVSTLPPCVVPIKNSRWEDFAQKFIEADNASEAARAVGFEPKSAGREAVRLLNIQEVKDRIAYLESEQRKKALITEGLITEELAIIAFSNPEDYVTAKLVTDPELITVKPGVNPKQIRAIAEIEVKDTAAGVRTVKLKLHSKTAALQMAIGLKGYGPVNKANGINGANKGKENGEGENENDTLEQIFAQLGLKVNNGSSGGEGRKKYET